MERLKEPKVKTPEYRLGQNLAQKLKHRRIELELRQVELSRMTGITRFRICNIERNVGFVTAIELWELSKSLQVKMEFFFADADVCLSQKQASNHQ